MTTSHGTTNEASDRALVELWNRFNIFIVYMLGVLCYTGFRLLYHCQYRYTLRDMIFTDKADSTRS